MRSESACEYARQLDEAIDFGLYRSWLYSGVAAQAKGFALTVPFQPSFPLVGVSVRFETLK